MGTRAVGV